MVSRIDRTLGTKREDVLVDAGERGGIMEDSQTGTRLHWRCAPPRATDVIGAPAGSRFAHYCEVWDDNEKRGRSNGDTHDVALRGALEDYF